VESLLRYGYHGNIRTIRALSNPESDFELRSNKKEIDLKNT